MTTFLLILNCVASAVLCYNICDDRDRPTWIGIVLGLALGWLGVIICFFFLKDKDRLN